MSTLNLWISSSHTGKIDFDQIVMDKTNKQREYLYKSFNSKFPKGYLWRRGFT